MAQQSSSHNCPIDNKKLLLMPGGIWAVEATGDNMFDRGKEPTVVADSSVL